MDADGGVRGEYSCLASNLVGRSKLVKQALVEVEEKPRVSLRLDPEHPINEMTNANVTLR